MYTFDICDDLIQSTHLLIAGTTGSGKSVLLKSLMNSVILSGSEYFLFDLKRVELAQFKNTQGCVKLVTEPEDVTNALELVINEMERRYQEPKGYLDLYVVIDELADTLTVKGVLPLLTKIGRLGRAANIHLLCATQDPSRRTLPAQLMQNFTCTVALRCRSAIESRQIIGVPGAEKLPQYGEGIRWDARGIQHIEIPMMEEKALSEAIGAFQEDKEKLDKRARFKDRLLEAGSRIVKGVGWIAVAYVTLIAKTVIWFFKTAFRVSFGIGKK